MLLGRVASAATGAAVAKAVVIERNLQTNVQLARYTNEDGLYSFAALQPGSYSIKVYALGFQPEERSPVELPVSSRIELNFALQAGAAVAGPASQPAAPAAAAPAPAAAASGILARMYGADGAIPQAVITNLPLPTTETLSGSLSSLIDERKILELALNGRDVYTLLVLQPGVSSDNATARGLGFSVNGQRAASSNYLLDGVDNNDLLVTGPAARVSADAVQEYRMNTNNFSAEFGRSSGFIANAITRSGTNALHGALFEFFNHDRLNANSFPDNWQGWPKPPFRQHQYGASLGGPLRRNRLFFFGNFERFRSASRSHEAQIYLPSDQLVALAPQGSLARQLLGQFPPPKADPIPGVFYATSRVFSVPLVQRSTLALGRIDYGSPGGKHRLSARYSLSRQTSDDWIYSEYPGLNAPLAVRGWNLAANYTRDLAGGSNELKFGHSRTAIAAFRPHPETPTIGLLMDPIALPGSEAAYDYSFQDTVRHVLDNFSRLYGKHALGMGFEWRQSASDSLVTPGRDGYYIFEGIFDFLRGDPSFLFLTLNRQTGRPAVDADFRRFYTQREFAAFLQDNWKIRPRLTLNLGVRFEYFGVPSAGKGTRDYNFVFGSGSWIGERTASGRLASGPLYQPDRNNLAPRFGFAWDLGGNGRTVLRGGYGLFLDRLFNNIWLDTRNNTLTLGTFQAGEFRYTFPARDAVQGVDRASLVASSTVAIDRGLRTPYSQSWFLGVQRQLGANTVVEVNQTGSLGRRLIATDMINRAWSVPVTEENPLGRYNVGTGDISYHGNQGHSNFAGFQAGLARRWSRGVQFQASYTWSHTKDVQSDPLPSRVAAQGEGSKHLGDVQSFFQLFTGFTRQFDPSADFGRADFDQTHNLVFNVIARTPQFRGWRRFAAGWQAAALAGFRSGFPFSVHSTELYLPEAGGLLIHNRADFLGRQTGQASLSKRKSVPGGVVMLDPAVFAPPTGGKIGNAQRNAFRGPGFWNADLSVSRSFPLGMLGEGGSLQFRAEFFNAFNHTNLNSPDANLESPDFGQAVFGRQGFSSSLPTVSPLNDQPRRIQFALKLYF